MILTSKQERREQSQSVEELMELPECHYMEHMGEVTDQFHIPITGEKQEFDKLNLIKEDSEYENVIKQFDQDHVLSEDMENSSIPVNDFEQSLDILESMNLEENIIGDTDFNEMMAKIENEFTAVEQGGAGLNTYSNTYTMNNHMMQSSIQAYYSVSLKGTQYFKG